MNRPFAFLIAIVFAAAIATGASSYHLRIGLYDGSIHDTIDITDLCEDVFEFTPTNVVPVNLWGDALADGYVGFDEDSLLMSYFNTETGDVIPIETFLADVYGFQPRGISVIHRFGDYDELLAWGDGEIVSLDLDDFELQDLTGEFTGAEAASGLCLDDFSNLDQLSLAYDGENWYSGYEYVTDTVNGFLGADVVRLTPVNVVGSTADDAIIFTFKTDNMPPVAQFTVNPPSGSSMTLFEFDASDSWDVEDDADDLRFRWDFDSDGIYDTELSYQKTANHLYSSSGAKEVTLLAMDTEGATGTKTDTLLVGNSAPSASFTFDPESGTIGTIFMFDASLSSD
ncbi:MAG: PKD domain-containing protein, partial [Candidatus Coatesbacteria bacterium]|nr:PKD domain-containing protein [Candidatus Coatesbacteria bacterium]